MPPEPNPPCNPCNSFCSSGELQQHLFLGLSVQEFSAEVGWGDTVSEISVVLVEDPCTAPDGHPKICYDVNLDRHESYLADPGFVGENRYLDINTGKEYSASVPINVGDTLLRNKVNILGSPVYFRFHDFEFGGVIGDWVKNVGSDGITYRIKITDPRIILEGCQLILGSYSDRIDKNIYCDPITPYNLFNVFGYMEGAGGGAFCPGATQYPQYTYNIGQACDFPLANDGAIIGSPMGYFGGAYRNDRGMPLFKIVAGINSLLNSLIIDPNILPFSPLGRIIYPCAQTSNLSSIHPCGLVSPDATVVGGPVSTYFLDISELPTFNDSLYYKIQDEVLSILDLITRVCQDASFDYYFELIFVKNVIFANGIGKFIKLRTVNRKVQPSLDNIANALSNVNCIENSSFGLEIRSEETSSFVIGGNKKTIFQAVQNLDPDSDGTDVVWGVSTFFNVLTGYVLSTESHVIFGDNLMADDMITPYFGQFQNKNVKLTYGMDAEDGTNIEQWGFLVETSEILSAMNALDLSGAEVFEITETDLRFALTSFDSWLSWIYLQKSKTSPYFRLFDLLLLNNPIEMANFSGLKDISQLLKNRGASKQEIAVARDAANPKKKQFPELNAIGVNALVYEDLKTLYNLVLKYAREYYGIKYMVRVPYTCSFPDVESIFLIPGSSIGYIANKIVRSERPSNSGGWTEYNNILGLSMYSIGLRFFVNDEGLIQPFVRVISDKVDLSNFSVDDFIVYWFVDEESSSIISQPLYEWSGEGGFFYDVPPSGEEEQFRFPTGENSNILYDPEHGMVYYKNSGEDYVPIDLSSSTVEDNLTDDPPTISFVRKSDNPGVVRIWNGEDWVDITFVIYIRAQVDEDYVFVNYSTGFSPRVIVTLPQALHQRRSSAAHIDGFTKMTNVLAANLGRIAAGMAPVEEALGTVGGKENLIGIHPLAHVFDAAAIPLESSILRYGPWFNYGTPGRIKVVRDDSLTPWNFGSYATMQLAGDIIAAETVSSMQFGEVGSVTIPGTPCLGLGAEIGAHASTYYQAGSHLLENREYTSGYSNGIQYGYVEIINWTGAYGPNITNISVSGGNSGFSTTYQMRTFANRRGTLNKYFLERLSESRQLNLQVNKRINQEVGRIFRNKSLAFQNYSDKRYLYPNNRIIGPGSEHEVLLGQDVPFGIIEEGENSGEYKFLRPILSTGRLDEAVFHLQEGYDKKAIMSLDGFFRNFSMDGSGGLTPYYEPTIENPNQTEGEIEVFDNCNLSGQGSKVIPSPVITLDLLNPFSNPSSFSRDTVVTEKSDTPNIGHDIEMLARSDSMPDGLIIPLTGYDNQYMGDYADDYRLMALRGPLVLKSWCYDLDGFPVPNKADTFGGASNGVFIDDKEELEDKFFDGWLRQSDCWPVAPVDLRLDRERGVFTIPTNLTKRNFAVVVPCDAETATGEWDGCLNDEQQPPPSWSGLLTNPFNAEIKYPILFPNSPGHKYISVYNPFMIEFAANTDLVFCLRLENTYIAILNYNSAKEIYLPFDNFEGYDGGKKQALIHNEEQCLEWLDLTDCESGEFGQSFTIPSIQYLVKQSSQERPSGEISGEEYLEDVDLQCNVAYNSVYRFNLFLIYSGGIKHKFLVPFGTTGNMVMVSNNENYSSLGLEEEKIEDTYTGEAIVNYSGVFSTPSSGESGEQLFAFMFANVSGEPDAYIYKNSYLELRLLDN